MSSELFRKYIDIINENSQEEIQLDEGKLAKALAVLGLSGLGIFMQHQAAMPTHDQMIRSPGFSARVSQILEKDPEHKRVLEKWLEVQRAGGPTDDVEKSHQELRGRVLSNDHYRAIDQAMETIQAEQPTLYNTIVRALNENSQLAENSVDKITDDEPRYEVIGAMGHARYYLSQIYRYFADPEQYTKNPQNLKNKLSIVTRQLAPLAKYERTPGLYANNPTAEYRLINTPEVNAFVHNLEYIYELIDNKEVEEVKKLFINAEKFLLDSAKEIHKAMGKTDNFNSYFNRR